MEEANAEGQLGLEANAIVTARDERADPACSPQTAAGANAAPPPWPRHCVQRAVARRFEWGSGNTPAALDIHDIRHMHMHTLRTHEAYSRGTRRCQCMG